MDGVFSCARRMLGALGCGPRWDHDINVIGEIQAAVPEWYEVTSQGAAAINKASNNEV